jgi:hypothetical protein
MELVKGPAAIEAGIVYLECEEYRFSVKEGGRTWSVYGSPVRRSNIGLVAPFESYFQWQPEFCGWAFNYKRAQAHGA